MQSGEHRATCPHCGQLLTQVRLGIRIGEVRARLLDLISKSGDTGITAEALYSRLFEPRGSSRSALYVHLSQLNNTIVDAGYRIERNKHDWRYRLVRE